MNLTNSDLLINEPEEDVFVFPASFAQQRLWFLDQFEPGSPFYNIPTAVRLIGQLDRQVLQRCLNEIVRRHEALRTTFTMMDGNPVQVIHPSQKISLPLIDLRDFPADQRQAEAMRLANLEARSPFDLSVGPLIRVVLIQTADQEHVVLVTMHHIVSDGWSIGVFIYELSMLYAAFTAGAPSPLPELPIQYADYSEWQRDWLQGDVLESQISYWTKQLGGFIPVLELPSDRPRPPVITSRGAALSASLSKSLTERIKSFSQQKGLTVFMTLLAGFQTLLYRYTGQTDITVGSPIANRRQAELEGLIGIFINTVVLRSDLSGEPTFQQVLERVKEVTLGAYANQDVPFEVIVDRLNLPRDMSHSPLFQVMFILQNAPVRAQRLPGMMLEPIDLHSGTSTFDLTLVAAEMADGFDLSVEFNTDLFNADTIQRLLRHLETLLEAATANPEQPIALLPILPQDERRLVLETWNETSSVDWSGADRKDYRIHDFLKLWAEKTPDAQAVILPGLESKPGLALSSQGVSRIAQLTYRELDDLSERLAGLLRQHITQPDQVVGVFMERSTELVAALFGILKAGGAYLPLDPNAPQERLGFIIEDASSLSPEGKLVILTHSRLVDRLVGIPAKVLALDEWLDNPSEPSSLGLHLPDNSQVKPDNLVYMTYTSGSTGQSKGVMVEHRSLVNAYLAWEESYHLTPGESHLQMANFTFDVFSGDLVRALCSGGKLVLCPREWLLSADRLFELMLAEGITITEFVPAVLRNLAQYLEKTGQRLDFMRLLACGSDSWYVGEYRKFQNLIGKQTRLVNSFGLTEATIDSTFFEGSTSHLSVEQLVPIGRPFANTKLFILDAYRQPCPIGIPGELYIGGIGLARGYHNRPDLNEERFIQNLFPVSALSRLYKTGDSARYLPDGNIEFLGRLDDQLKIRGFRIEPGEIEAALGSYPKIKEAAVVAVEVSIDDKRLAAYLVADPDVLGQDSVPTTGELRRYLQDRLPDYMVPAVFIFVDALPLNASGKVDRRALAEMQGIDWSERVLVTEYVAPRTPIEETLVDIWTQVLGVQQIGIYDNFFELGGHSLLATQLISRVREIFSVDLPLRNLFESPTILTLAENINAFRQAQAGGRDSLVGLGLVEAPPMLPLPRDPVSRLPAGPVPLSFAQQRLWFLDQLEPDSPFYNLPEAVRLTGNLDEQILEKCLNEVVRRHEALRTTFQVKDGIPIQVVAPKTQSFRIQKSDLTRLPPGEREPAAMEIARQEAQKPFNLASGPLLRACLVRLAPEDHLVVLTMHHIVGDNWSSNILIQEVAILYDAFTNGRPSPLPELPIQYTDFSAWQRAWLQGEVLQEQIDYWKKQLIGLPPILELPTDRPRPAMQTFNGDFRTVALPVDLSARLRSLSQSHGATLFMTLLAAFNVLLYRYTGQEDISVGSPIANRTRGEVESLIGFFVNTLVFRGDLSGQPSFSELLGRIRETALGAFAHQDLPFEMVVDALQPERNLSHSPLFQVMFALQTTARTAVTLPASGLKLGPVDSHSGTSKFDLTLFMMDDGSQISGALEFNTDLFDVATIERMLGHFHNLLASLVDQPDLPVGSLELLSTAERQQILYDWNQTAAPIPDDKCAHHLFEDQVVRTPGLPAVFFSSSQPGGSDQSWSYHELNQRANRLAHALQKLGVGPDSLVGLCVERSPEMVLGLLGVLKAGGAYVPLDPTYPAERLSFMLSDSNAQVLLTQAHLAAQLQTSPNVKVILLDQDWSEIELESSKNPTSPVNPANLAYVIYTSGSTGLPKGAMIHHRGLVNYLTWCVQAYPLPEGQGSPVHSSISFDLTVTSLLSPLVSGRAAFLLPEGLGVELLSNALKYQASLKHPPFSLIKITPAHLQLLSEQIPAEEAQGCTRSFIIGGENLTVDHIRFWQQYAPETALVNEYGPTETVVGCCVYWTPPGSSLASDRFRAGIVPIGRPIINTQLYILDVNQQPLPVGVPGELYIGGAGVARGYLNRPELTSEKFIINPFVPGEQRLYRTGDLARYLPDGNIECLGRVDFQVKIRGFRVELGEIEAVLNQHPLVSESVVWYWEESGYKNLAAYVIPNELSEIGSSGELPEAIIPPPASISISDLRQHLQARLPDYMIPAAFVFMNELPLSPNGKVDRKRLPKPELTRLDSITQYIAPRTPQEEIIAGIFAEILGLARVSSLDNFFDLGGHSLLATQVISRLRDAFETDLPLRVLFEAPTVAGLAGQVESYRRINLGLQMPPITRLPRDPETGEVLERPPLSFSQQRLWVLDQLMPGAPLYNIPTFFQVDGSLNSTALQASLNRVVQRHESLRTIFAQADGKPVQVVLPELKVSVPVIDLTHLSPEVKQSRVMELARQEALKPFDLAQGPLLRLSLLHLSEEQHVILLNTHHIITDDWSLGIFIREILTFYWAEIEQSQAFTLPVPELQYPDFAAWQRNWLQGAVLENQLDYWKEQLVGLPPLLELPLDRPRPAAQAFNGAQVTFELAGDQLEKLKALSRQEGATLFMGLLAAFQAFLSRYTGQEDFAVGTPIANRTRSEMESMIGFFVNTLVLRGDLSGAPTFRTLLQRARETTLGAYAHQDIPFEMLVDALNPARDMSYHPLFQVMLVHQNAPRQMPKASNTSSPGAEIALKPLELHEGIARFDLTLTLVETPTVELEHVAEEERYHSQLNGSLEYNTDLFDRSTIERMIVHFKNLITGLLDQPDQPVGIVPMLADEERRYILENWVNTPGVPPETRCVHQLFEQQVRITPTAQAVIFTGGEEEHSLSYQELNQQANRLAYLLVEKGVRPESLVGICVERSLEMAIGLLGILKAGGAYLPLDPAYPQDRLAYMLADSGVQIILTQEKLLSKISLFAGLSGGQEVICLDQEWPEIELPAQEVEGAHSGPKVQVGMQNLAYVIYTSGSTGRPKGVLLQHGGLTNLVLQQIKGFGVDAHSRVLQFASFSFDASVSEIFMGLLSGGCLVFTTQEILGSMPDLLQVMQQQAVTTVTLPPSLLRVLDVSLVNQILPSLKTLISAGEACPLEVGARWAVKRQMFNAYGPTEATIGPTFYPLQSEIGENEGQPQLIGVPPGCLTVPIGRPIPNMEVYLLDVNRQLTPVGVPGEIYLGGIGLARGYLNQPELTAEKFVDHPFKPVQRLYRTGDLARYLPDGNIEYLGRVDFQVKVRGYRIELGEVESQLSQLEGVRTAVVIAREDRPGEKRLVAYLVPEPQSSPEQLSSDGMKLQLRERLPEYMIPSVFVVLDRLPLTPNGKVDRKALPAVDMTAAVLSTPYVAPLSEREKILASIWAEIIGFTATQDRPTIGIHDNFFELGGDSILSIQVIARAAQAGLRLTPRQLFETPTIAGLAAAAEDLDATQPAEEQPVSAEQISQNNLEDFGWSQDDLDDILGAIGSSLDDDEPAQT